MSGVVMSRIDEDDVESYEVICVSSGTKCINGEQLSLEGCVINDSHAEIVARRGVMLFCYKQLELFLEDPEKSIFEPIEDGTFK